MTMKTINDKIWGILQFSNCKVVFVGGDCYVQKYFSNFFSSIISQENEMLIKNTIKVEFEKRSFDSENTDNNERYKIFNNLFYCETKSKKQFEYINKWKIISYSNTIKIQYCSYESFDVLNQILRNIILEKLKNFNLISMHSSCLFCKDNIYVILGYSGTGKSTISIGMGLKDDVVLVNDDRIVLSIENNSVSHFGTPVTFRLGTEKILPKLGEYIVEYSNILEDEKHKTKIGINFKGFFGKERINNINGNFIFLFLKQSQNVFFEKLNNKDKQNLLIEFWENQEIVCFKKNLSKLLNNDMYIFGFKKGGIEDFNTTLDSLQNIMEMIKSSGK